MSQAEVRELQDRSSQRRLSVLIVPDTSNASHINSLGVTRQSGLPRVGRDLTGA
jgi:hypothetical protein